MTKKTVKPKLKTKAIKTSGTLTATSIVTPETITFRSEDAETFLKYAKGTVAACGNKIATAVSSIYPRLYSVVDVDTKGNALSRYRDSNGMSVKGITGEKIAIPHRKLEKAFMDNMLKTKGIRIEDQTKQSMVEITRHPLVTLLRQPMQGMDWGTWIEVVVKYYAYIGNAYAVIVLDDGIPVELRLLQAECVTPKFDKLGRVVKFEYRPYSVMSGRLDAVDYAPDEILWFRRLTAGSIFTGRGNLEEVIESFGVQVALNDYVRALLNHSAMPSAIITVKNCKNYEDFAAQAAMLEARLAGYRNSGKMVTQSGNLEIHQLSTSMADTKIDVITPSVYRDVLNGFGVPIDLMDSSNSNKATSYSALYQFKTGTVFPMVTKLFNQFDIQITQRFFDDDLTVYFDKAESLEKDPIEQADYLTKLTAGKPILTQNEARNVLGYLPVDDPMADKLIMPNGSADVQNAQAKIQG